MNWPGLKYTGLKKSEWFDPFYMESDFYLSEFEKHSSLGTYIF